MAKKYLDTDGLLYVWQKITNAFVKKDGNKVLSTNDYTTTEKNKLAGIAEGATKTIVDTDLSSSSTNPVQNKAVNAALGTKVDKVDGKGLSTNDYTTTEKTKLAGIAEGANKTIVDSAMSSESTNPVQNKVISTALGTKVDKVDGKVLSSNDYTTTEKNKLAGIAEGANKTTIVNNLTSTSTSSALSAAQGKVLNEKIAAITDNMEDLGAGDMLKSVYDINGDGVVDNAEKLGGQAPSYYAKASDIPEVPTNLSAFTDDVGYEKTDNRVTDLSVSGNRTDDKYPTAKAAWDIAHELMNDLANTITPVLAVVETTGNKVTEITDASTDEQYPSANAVYDLVSNKLSAVMTYKGTVASYSALPTNAKVGDTYNITAAGDNNDAGDNAVWNGSSWDILSGTIDLSAYMLSADLVAITNSEIDTIVAGA